MPRLRADDDGAVRSKSNVLKQLRHDKSDEVKNKKLTFTAENFFLSAHTLCGLNALPSPEVESKPEEGAEKVNTSPFDERAANVSSQHVIFEICESLIDCGGR